MGASTSPDPGMGAGAVLLQCKGRTLLMASGKDGLFTLLAAAGQSVQQSAAAKLRKIEVSIFWPVKNQSFAEEETARISTFCDVYVQRCR